jgi:hypothetical protein
VCPNSGNQIGPNVRSSFCFQRTILFVTLGKKAFLSKIHGNAFKIVQRLLVLRNAPAPVYQGVAIFADYDPSVQHPDSCLHFLVCPSPNAALFPASPCSLWIIRPCLRHPQHAFRPLLVLDYSSIASHPTDHLTCLITVSPALAHTPMHVPWTDTCIRPALRIPPTVAFTRRTKDYDIVQEVVLSLDERGLH